MNYNLFTKKLEDAIGNVSITENGAAGYATSGKAILDMNFKIASYRNRTAAEIVNDFKRSLEDTPRVALKWLFFARDVRGGAGERRLFRICMNWLANEMPDLVREFVPIIADYGRYDDVLELANVSALRADVAKFVWTTLTQDMANYNQKKSISLLAKWMPSENASSPATKAAARKWINLLGLTPKVYRKMLSKLRAYIDVIEVKMSGNDWDEIDYEAVPSKANLNYKDAFMRHDADRRQSYLNALQKGEAKINSTTLFPHEIYSQVDRAVNSWRSTADVTALEAMWKALPDYVKGDDTTVCVRDGSGSMTSTVSGNISALDIASALSVYFAERCKGAFKNKIITFSENPRLIDLSSAGSLAAKTRILRRYDECANTNIEAVFDLFLQIAKENDMSQEDLPKNIIIYSDMEFDRCTTCYGRPTVGSYSWDRRVPVTKKLFDEIKKRYERAGYKLPRLIFWNINSRTDTIPVIKNDLGVALVSGFSTAIVKMVLSGKLDPFECLVETLDSKRYDAVEAAIKRYIAK